jgi:hypothetical protein
VFVGVVRILLEWIIGHRPLAFLNQSILASVSFYLLVLFLYTAPLAIIVKQPWRTSMNVVLAAVFCGLLPPLIDGTVSGAGTFVYDYVFDFPAGWPWSLYAPAGGLPLGESVVLWLTIALISFYVWRKTRSAWRTVVAGFLGYGVVAFDGGILPTVLARSFPRSGWDGDGRVIVYGQLATALFVYLSFRPPVALGLLRRAQHTAPFILVCLIGAAMKGRVDSSVMRYAALLFLATLVALAQNDHFDRDEDARQRRPLYLDGEDVAVLTTIFLLFLATLISAGSVMGYLLLVFFVVSLLYSHPLYRGKRFFPANLKSEGIWGSCAFLIGVTGSVGSALALDPVNRPLADAAAHSPLVVTTFDASTIIALALVFCGWSLVAALKDYKDVRADARAGIQTVYTLAVRRRWGLRRMHRILSGAVALSMLVPFALLTFSRDWPIFTAAAGVPFAGALLIAASRRPSRKAFHVMLATINLLLFAILAALWGSMV